MVTLELRPLLILALVPLALTPLALRYDPQRPAARLLVRMLRGLLLLAGWNLASGFSLGVNPLSALISGALGLPGLGLLAVISLL